MKKLLAFAALGISVAGANAQSLPQGFEISGDLTYTFAFSGSGNGNFGLGDIDLGYRHEVNADIAIGAGLTSYFVFGDVTPDSRFSYYVYADYRNFRLSYGNVANAASHFDWEFVSPQSNMLRVFPFVAPIGLNPLIDPYDDVLRLDADLGRYQLSASYINSIDLFSLAAQTQIGNARILAVYDRNMGAINHMATLGVDYSLGDFELGAAITYVWGLAPFDFSSRFSAAYHVNDRLTVKALYMPDVFVIDTYLLEVSAIYQVNDRFSISASLIDGPLAGGDTTIGIDARASF